MFDNHSGNDSRILLGETICRLVELITLRLPHMFMVRPLINPENEAHTGLIAIRANEVDGLHDTFTMTLRYLLFNCVQTVTLIFFFF